MSEVVVNRQRVINGVDRIAIAKAEPFVLAT
jgi:hypothetical protein